MTRFHVFAVIYLVIGLLFLLYYYKKRKMYKDKFAYNGVFFGIILYYIVVPAVLMCNIQGFIDYEATREIYGDNSIYKYIYNAPSYYIIFSFILIVIFFIFFNLGYKISKKRDEYKVLEMNNNLEVLIKFFIYFTFIIGIISLLLYSLAFGGIKQALEMAEYYRSFANEASATIGSNSLLIITARLITVTPFLLAYYLEKYKKKEYSLYYILLYSISLIFSIIYYLLYAGRFPLICFLLAIFYVFIRNKIKKPWLLIICLGVVCLPLLDVFDTIFTSFSLSSLKNIKINYFQYIYQFIHPIRNVINVIPLTQNYGMNYFTDILLGMFDILPGITINASYIPTSEYFYGMNWKNIGGIPNDVITFAYYQLGIIAVIIISLGLGYVLQKIDFRLEKITNNCKYYIGAYLSTICFGLVNNADTVSFVKSQFFLIILFVILILSTRKKVKI